MQQACTDLTARLGQKPAYQLRHITALDSALAAEIMPSYSVNGELRTTQQCCSRSTAHQHWNRQALCSCRRAGGHKEVGSLWQVCPVRERAGHWGLQQAPIHVLASPFPGAVQPDAPHACPCICTHSTGCFCSCSLSLVARAANINMAENAGRVSTATKQERVWHIIQVSHRSCSR